MQKLFQLLSMIVLSTLFLASAAQANEAPEVAYINLSPALVGNFAAGGSKLKFYKADIALRVAAAGKSQVQYHEPLIRDQLVGLFSQKTEEDFATIEGKEAVRKDALLRVQQVLQQEEGEPLVDDLLFNNLVIQK